MGSILSNYNHIACSICSMTSNYYSDEKNALQLVCKSSSQTKK